MGCFPQTDIQIWQRWGWASHKASNWCNAMDFSRNWGGKPKVDLSCQKERISETCPIQAAGGRFWITKGRFPHWFVLASIPWVARFTKKQHDFESCWVLTLPKVARCSCILQLFMFIYNAWHRVQYSSLRTHRHMHNLPQILWAQTSQSSASGRLSSVRKSCWWQFCWHQAFVKERKKKKKTNDFIHWVKWVIQIVFLIRTTETRT